MRSITDTKSLIEWLRKQGNRHYDYDHCRECALAQYFTQMYGVQAIVGTNHFSLPYPAWDEFPAGHHTIPMPAGWDEAACRHPHTFSAMADRLSRLG